MQRGPKGKPVEIAIRDGTHKSRIPNPPLRTDVEAHVERPDYFNHYQNRAWDELVEMLTALDVLDSADAQTLETCAAMVGRMREARYELNRGEKVTMTQRGAEVPSPWWKIEKEAAQQVSRFLAELGLTPSARARLANLGVKSRRPEETLDDILGQSGRLKVLEGGKP